jgi:OmpA-OmpF porin, OOP family
MTMRKISLVIATALLSSTAYAAPPAAAVDLNCALYSECGQAAEEQAVPAAAPNPNVRRSTTRGFSMTGPAAPTAAKPAAKAAATAGRTKLAVVNRPKPTVQAVQAMQSVQAVKAAQLITFKNGSSELTADGTLIAQKIAIAMLRPDKVTQRFSLQGHTDAVGGRDYNLALSERRAKALADFLAAQGVSPNRFETKGFGFDQPLSGLSRTSPSNRRVEVKPVG